MIVLLPNEEIVKKSGVRSGVIAKLDMPDTNMRKLTSSYFGPLLTILSHIINHPQYVPLCGFAVVF